MVQLSQHQFFLIVSEIFGSVISDYGFEIFEENDYMVIAKKEDCELIFRLEAGLYCSLAIKLSGELGQKATADSYFREIGVENIAKCLDPTHKRPFKESVTEEDLRIVLESYKEELLKYCETILLGDVSLWQKVVECVKNSELNKWVEKFRARNGHN